MSISRRSFLMGLPLFVAGCSTITIRSDALNYASIRDEQFPVAALPLSKFDPELRRREVAFDGDYPAGTIVVNTPERRLYYVLGNGRAMRYGVGVGKQGLALRGNATVGRKAEWPSWTPTANMMRNTPRYRKYAGGVPGGPNNPLGARAIYLYRGGRDTMFRIHGTNQPSTIGGAVSSGCIRMTNHDVIDLYERVTPGAKVVVIQA
ncbi:L,D-transpeptidase [Nitratireductor aquibiodomus]|uniref:L,D-transpeptidase n=1 Tax=Nitratireductor aquibiodomus TaxID=204799 RepID=UPI0019D3C608|nr:L,D-transpeptidase [Nitratireductor aquibiodomus]MBN7763465.1 L,D-transpeptidase [Nitratireductor aquibiodomus]